MHMQIQAKVWVGVCSVWLHRLWAPFVHFSSLPNIGLAHHLAPPTSSLGSNKSSMASPSMACVDSSLAACVVVVARTSSFSTCSPDESPEALLTALAPSTYPGLHPKPQIYGRVPSKQDTLPFYKGPGIESRPLYVCAQDKAIKALTAALAPKAKAMRNGKLVSVRFLPGSIPHAGLIGRIAFVAFCMCACSRLLPVTLSVLPMTVPCWRTDRCSGPGAGRRGAGAPGRCGAR